MSNTRSPSPKARPKPEPNEYPAVIEANAVYTLEEAAKRMRWKRHSTRQALRSGLVTARFGSRRYVVGQAVLDLMQKLGEQQADEGNGEECAD